MAKDSTNKKVLYGGLATLFVIALVWAIIANNKTVEDYDFPEPSIVVEQYFTSWSNKNYPDMYSTISDGFKRIEPSAKNFQDFKAYVNSQNIKSINIVNTETITKDKQTAKISYNTILTTNEGKIILNEGIFTLKYRIGDVIKGWKLIHPYGENIDNT